MTRLFFSVYSGTRKAVLILKEARTQPEAAETVSSTQPAVGENANQHKPLLQQNLKQPALLKAAKKGGLLEKACSWFAVLGNNTNDLQIKSIDEVGEKQT